MKRESLNPEGRPPMYDKAKIRVNLTLTEDSIRGLDAIAAKEGPRSELVERMDAASSSYVLIPAQEVAELGKLRLGSLQPSMP